jgi:predicted RNA-binding protein with RPS1 domain
MLSISEKLNNTIKMIESHKQDTRNKKYVRKVSQTEQFKHLYEQIVLDIEEHDYKCISTNCLMGKNRSVSMARMLCSKYPNATITHLDVDS